MCLHTIDLDDTMCEAPSCLLDPEPGQAIRDQDPEQVSRTMNLTDISRAHFLTVIL